MFVVFVCIASLFPSSGNRALIYCGEPIPFGLAEYMTRSGLPEFCSSLAAVMKAQACNSGQATRALSKLRKLLATRLVEIQELRTVCVPCGESLRRSSEASRKDRELSSDVIFLEALDPAVPKACPTSGLERFVSQ